jgi:hypothetical protein
MPQSGGQAFIAVGSLDATRYSAADGTLFLEYLAKVMASLPMTPLTHEKQSGLIDLTAVDLTQGVSDFRQYIGVVKGYSPHTLANYHRDLSKLVNFCSEQAHQ